MVLLNSFFRANSYNPDLPAETWELIFSKNTGGNYNTTLGWGKYKAVISGGGGSGGAHAAGESHSSNWSTAGYAAEEKVVFFNVEHGGTTAITGVIGYGAKGSYAYAEKEAQSQFGDISEATVGTAGAGYNNGSAGSKGTAFNTESGVGSERYNGFAAASGSGGGSSSFVVDGTIKSISAGGNGGDASVHLVGKKTGGIGGSGGTTSGSGAAGGASKGSYDGGGTSGNGSDGYIRIYKSNLRPEDA